MKQQEYLIGDIAAITGISRDTLRFYEKKGILTAKKKANGYRYFTEEDLYQLVHILFSRKLNFGLDTIEELLETSPLSPDYQNSLKQKISAEIEAIQFHKQTLSCLLSMQKIYHDLQSCLNQFCLKPFPESCLLSTISSPSEGLSQWFLLSQKYPGLDMVYLYDCYQYQSGFSLTPDYSATQKSNTTLSYEAELTYEQSYLIFYQEIISRLELDYDFSGCQPAPTGYCVHTTVEGSSPKPLVSLITSMREWAANQGILVSSQVIVTSNFSRISQEVPCYYQEIYIPILSSYTKSQ